jgi:DNA mismatch endonuclease (patch repair protein)
MPDRLSPQQRSALMRRIGSKNTLPEVVLRQALHSVGLRFRLHQKHLPGTPDIVLLKYRTVIFVHGCYWHRHGCNRTYTPSKNREFWNEKFRNTILRDQRVKDELTRLGWTVVLVWECELRTPERAQEVAVRIKTGLLNYTRAR